MRALVFSDSHGSISEMLDVIERVKADLIIHLGDLCRDAENVLSLTDKPLIYVAGNCDVTVSVKREIITEIEGVNVYITHGNQYYGDANLIAEAAERNNCKIALFGHTHIPADEYISGIRVINPGSISRPRYPATLKTYAVIEFQNGSFKSNLYNI